jgi:Helix-turn-helix of DDE superfamily endonuclease
LLETEVDFKRGKSMMKIEVLKKMSEAKFRRITGVKRKTFDKMVELVEKYESAKKERVSAGRPRKLSVETRILMTLEYLREYRTYAHIAASYNISETRTFENIREIENILVRSKEFRLPGKRALLKSENEYEIVLIDASETPIERPKKNKSDFTQGKKSVIP